MSVEPSDPIVICGAGIAGVAAAYYLAVEQGCTNVVLVEAGAPLSLTSDKSTEAYRNWWPGPDRAITAYMNHSIDLLEGFARRDDNRINLNRRGYAFATADVNKIPWLERLAGQARDHGAGAVRMHSQATSSYEADAGQSFDKPVAGVDFITCSELIRRHFGYLNPATVAVAHARRAGSLSAQQLGMTMLEDARAAGVRLVRGEITAIDTVDKQLHGVRVRTADGQTRQIATGALILCAGPMLKNLAAQAGVDLPIVAERHHKISLPDTDGIVPRTAPMLIWLDEQRLPFSDDEIEVLAADGTMNWLLENFPAGVHCRPEGAGSSQTLLGLYNYKNIAQDVVFPLPEEPHYAEIVVRGLSTMIPGLQRYLEAGLRPYVDGGYYIRTRENRPLIGPLPVAGLYVSGAYSGFGIMAACAGGDLIARHVVGGQLPDYAPAFLLSRYQDPDYQALLARWGDDGQL